MGMRDELTAPTDKLENALKATRIKLRTLFRLDAMHCEGDGAFVLYFEHSAAAVTRERELKACGWFCDVAPVELQLTDLAANLLCLGTWPLEDDETIVGLMRNNPLDAAKVRLEECLKAQELRRELRVADES